MLRPIQSYILYDFITDTPKWKRWIAEPYWKSPLDDLVRRSAIAA